MPINIVIADDHPVVASGIARDGGTDVRVLGQASASSEIFNSIREFQPDVLVMEVRLGGQDALKSLENVKHEYPDCKVVVFSGFNNPSHIARAAALGCHDYILKTADGNDLIQAIRKAAGGDDPPENSLLITTRTKMRRRTVSQDIPLTSRETQVLQHVSMGLSNREVGKSLGISVETVKEHVQNILRKLDVNDRTQAAVWAVKRGIV